MPSVDEHAGGEEALHRLDDAFSASVLADPLLQPLFGAGQPHHVDHLTTFTAECFGGSDRFTKELGGFEAPIALHRGLRITEAQRRFSGVDAPGVTIKASARSSASRSTREDGAPAMIADAPDIRAFGMMSELLADAKGTSFADPELRSWESLGVGGVVPDVVEWAG